MKTSLNSVFVTGASTGIGAACALRLAAGGTQVFAGVRNAADGDALRALRADAAVEAALGAASAADWPSPVAAFEEIQTTGAGQWL